MEKIYLGSCHCGLIRFKVIADVDHLRECNCSICLRRGALIFRVPSDSLSILTPFKQAKLYQWGTKTAEDYFCANCGVLPFRKPSQLTPAEVKAGKIPFTGWSINARCLDGLDVQSLPIIKIDGASL